jgi:transposase
MSLVGLDVHASQTHAAVLDTATGELRGVRLRMPPTAVAEFLATLPGPVRAVYEAGPTGFGLARAAIDRGVDVRVVAAGRVPRASGDRVKTDRRDAERLARLLAAGELRFAFVPTIADERFRDLIRAIEDCRGDLMRSRHRLSKFLLRRDVRWIGPGSAWTTRHMNWLRARRFDDVCSQATFVDYLAAVDLLVGRRAALIAALEQAIPDSSHAAAIARLRCFRGIDTLSAAGLCAEIATGRASGPSSCRASSGSSPASTPRPTSADRARSPRPDRCTPADCSSRPPTTTVTTPRSVTRSADDSTAKTPGSSRSPGAPNAACTSAGRSSPASAASPPASSRSPAPASSPPSAGRPPPSAEPIPRQPPREPVLPGRAREHRASRSSRRAVREPAMGNHRPFGGGARL